MCPKNKELKEECKECIAEINEHVNGVMGVFEVKSSEMFENFEEKQKESLEKQSLKADEAISIHLKNQEDKHDVAFERHLDIQAEKYDRFLDKQDKRENIKTMAMIAFVTIFITVGSAVVWHDSALHSDLDKTINMMKTDIDSKPSRKEIPLMNEIKMLRDLGDAYNDAKFVKKDHITSDTSAYYWARINIYGSTMRGEHEFYKSEYNKIKKIN
jgi:hypothetical protein